MAQERTWLGINSSVCLEARDVQQVNKLDNAFLVSNGYDSVAGHNPKEVWMANLKPPLV